MLAARILEMDSDRVTAAETVLARLENDDIDV
jgi:hypothetical protein